MRKEASKEGPSRLISRYSLRILATSMGLLLREGIPYFQRTVIFLVKRLGICGRRFGAR